MPRLATVVPSVVSFTVMPIIRPSVNRLLTMRWPNSVLEANSSSRCSGCTFMVSELYSTLSISVTVRVQAWSNTRPDREFLEIKPRHLPPREQALLARMDAAPARHRINAATGRNIEDGAEPMRAMMSETPGGPESLKLMELPSKPLGKGQVRVAVRAAGRQLPRHADHRRQVPVQAAASVRAGPRDRGRHHRSGRGRQRLQEGRPRDRHDRPWRLCQRGRRRPGRAAADAAEHELRGRLRPSP